jgi:hypothetical protein
MNLIKKIFSLWVVFFVVDMQAQAQSIHPILDDFNLIEIDGTVYIDATISAGNLCSGIYVHRSEDSLTNYNVIGHVGGICGSFTEPVTYSFVDESPVVNKTSYYKLELGNNNFTEVVSILIIDTREFGFQIRPNPADDKAIIFYENGDNSAHTLTLYHSSGVMIKTLVTETNQFNLNTLSLGSGMYVFTIVGANHRDAIKGKLMVRH